MLRLPRVEVNDIYKKQLSDKSFRATSPWVATGICQYFQSQSATDKGKG